MDGTEVFLMIAKSPESYSLIQYVGVLTLAIWGGVINYLRRMRAARVPTFSIVELIGEVATSGFAGVLVFWLCEAAGVHALVTAATVGVAGHIGGRSLILIEEFLLHKLPIIPSRSDDSLHKFETLDSWINKEDAAAINRAQKEEKDRKNGDKKNDG